MEIKKFMWLQESGRERERENGVRTKREKLNSVEPFDFMVKIITIS